MLVWGSYHPEETIHGFRDYVLIYDSMTPNESRPNVKKQVTFTDKDTSKKFLFSKDSLFLKGTEKLIFKVEKTLLQVMTSLLIRELYH